MRDLIAQYGYGVIAPLAIWMFVQFLGSVVDFYQALWIFGRHRARKKRRLRAEIKSELLYEQHEGRKSTVLGAGSFKEEG